MTAWTDEVKRVFHQNKKSNPNYKLGDAMKDARKTYKKSPGSVSSENGTKKSRGSRSRKGRSRSRSRRSSSRNY